MNAWSTLKTDRMKKPLQIGTRSSRLALIQAEWTQNLLSEKFPDLKWEVAPHSSPGDRDKDADLLSAPDDFFTRDLDLSLLEGSLDCAVHSAKDLPADLPEGIDWCWLPGGADPRDVLVFRNGTAVDSIVGQASCIQEPVLSQNESTRSTTLRVDPKVVGVSSERRIAYAKQRFPNAELKPLRGTIGERLAQLDTGNFDCILMAAAALQRLGLEECISEWIPLDAMPIPDGQGRLALTFRAGDKRFLRLRAFFVKPVVFVSAGTRAGLCTQAGVAALRHADACLYDALLDDALLNELPDLAQKIFVGKRSGKHSREQNEICDLLVLFARQGKRVVRLKGGDSGMYGRLAEEIDMLDARQLPYRVIPGVSSLSTATTGTGLLLTRRGVADRMRVISGHPGQVPGETLAVFMGIKSLGKTVTRLLDEGKPPALPVSVVFNAGREDQQIVSGALSDIVSKLGPTDAPGLALIGETANEKFLYRSHGALRGKRIWLTCSAAIQERAAQAVLDFGGVPVQQPLIELIPVLPIPPFGHPSQGGELCEDVCVINNPLHGGVPEGRGGFSSHGFKEGFFRADNFLTSFDWLIVTSPSAVRCLMTQIDDLRALPKILCCGVGTAKTLAKFRVQADAMPAGEFNTAGVLAAAKKHIPKDARILRVRSDRAGEALSVELRETFTQVEDVVICRNQMVKTDVPVCDVVFFASVSAVESFMDQFGVEALEGKLAAVIGTLDAAALKANGIEQISAPKRSAVEAAVEALALACVNKELSS